MLKISLGVAMRQVDQGSYPKQILLNLLNGTPPHHEILIFLRLLEKSLWELLNL